MKIKSPAANSNKLSCAASGARLGLITTDHSV